MHKFRILNISFFVFSIFNYCSDPKGSILVKSNSYDFIKRRANQICGSEIRSEYLFVKDDALVDLKNSGLIKLPEIKTSLCPSLLSLCMNTIAKDSNLVLKALQSPSVEYALKEILIVARDFYSGKTFLDMAGLELRFNNGDPLIFLPLRRGNSDQVLRTALMPNFNVNIDNDFGTTLMHEMAANGFDRKKSEAMKMCLLREDINSSCQDSDGNTPLMLLMYELSDVPETKVKKRVIAILEKEFRDRNTRYNFKTIVNKSGESAFIIARKLNKQEFLLGCFDKARKKFFCKK